MTEDQIKKLISKTVSNHLKQINLEECEKNYIYLLSIFSKDIANDMIERELLMGLGLLYMDLDKWDKAVDLFSGAVKKYNNSIAIWHLCLAHLNAGNFDMGISLFGSPFKTNGDNKYPTVPLPYNNYDLDLFKDKNVLILNDEGLGDEMMFSRVLPKINEITKSVTIQVYEENLELFKKIYPELKLFSDRNIDMKFVRSHDCYTSTSTLFSMYKEKDILNNFSVDFEEKTPYEDFKLGICALVNSKSPNVHERSLTQKQIEIFRPLGKFLNISKNDIKNDFVTNIGNKYDNFYTTAKIINSLDYVITVDTSLAHLSGLIGKETFVIINKHHDWRWKYNTIENDIRKSRNYKNVWVIDINNKNDMDFLMNKITTHL